MKGIIKLFPAALAMFALASCSNEDFLGSENTSGKLQLEATVEAPNSDDGTTRAAFLFTSTDEKSQWQEDDVFRVYDAALQKYDEFKRDGSVIAVQGTPVVDKHSKAIFPGNKVYYAGYDKKNNDVIAIMDVPSDVTYGGPVITSDGTVYYVSNMPMWGDVKNPDVNKLQVELKTLTAFTDIAVYQKSVKYIRVLALNEKNAADVALNSDAVVINGGTGTLANMSTDALVTLDKNTTNGKIFATNTPLAGFFEAQLKPKGVLKANTTNPVLKDSYKSYIEVDLSENTADEAHIYVPIIAGVKYKNLTIQTSTDGTTWTTLKRYAKDSQFDRNGALRKDLVCGLAPITAVVSSLDDLNKKLQIIADNADYKGRTVNITATGDIKTSQDLANLIIPSGTNVTANQIVNFNFPIDDTDNPLTISGGKSGITMTINLNQGISGNTAVTINTAGKLVLTGSITSSRSDQYKKINVTNAQELTFGSSEDFKSFNTNMDIVSGKDLIIDAAEGTIENVSLSSTAALKVETGKVKTVASASTGTITIEGGEVTTINKTAATGNVTIGAAKVGTLEAKEDATFTTTVKKGAVITNLYLSKSSGVVSITDAAVTTLETNAADVTTTSGSTTIITAKGVTIKSQDANATVGTLKLYQAVNIDLVGDTGDNAYTAKISTLDGNSKKATVSSTGKAVISTASSLASGSSFTSDWNNKKIATTDITSGNIYTAAQLAGIQANTAYTLKTNITSSAAWTPVNLSGNFTAESLSVTVKGAPLFNKISGTAVVGGSSDSKVMTLETGNITGAEDENNLGSLAKEVDGTVTVKFVKANAGTSGTTSAPGTGVTIQGNATKNNAENIGGLIGKASGTVTLQDIQLGGNTALTLKGHANVGGFIGNVAGGTVKILTSKEWKSKIAFAVQGSYTTPDAKAGTFGNFIGSITGAGVSVDIHSTNATPTNNISSFFDLTSSGIRIVTSGSTSTLTPNLSFTKNYIEDGSVKKYYNGMIGKSGYTSQALTFEIGYSPVATVGTIYLYNTTTDTIGNPVSIGLSDINQFK